MDSICLFVKKYFPFLGNCNRKCWIAIFLIAAKLFVVEFLVGVTTEFIPFEKSKDWDYEWYIVSFVALISAVLAIYLAYGDSKTMANIKTVTNEFEPSINETRELLSVRAENPQKPLTFMDLISKLLINSDKQLNTLNSINASLQKQATSIDDLHVEKFPKGVPDEIRRRNPIPYNDS